MLGALMRIYKPYLSASEPTYRSITVGHYRWSAFLSIFTVLYLIIRN